MGVLWQSSGRALHLRKAREHFGQSRGSEPRVSQCTFRVWTSGSEVSQCKSGDEGPGEAQRPRWELGGPSFAVHSGSALGSLEAGVLEVFWSKRPEFRSALREVRGRSFVVHLGELRGRSFAVLLELRDRIFAVRFGSGWSGVSQLSRSSESRRSHSELWESFRQSRSTESWQS